MNQTHFLLGSNSGDCTQHLLVAKNHIQKYIGIIIKESRLYQTAAWGKTDQPDFINQVIIVSTLLDAFQTMKKILEIETNMGRVRTEKNATRIIDIDILFFNKEVHHTPFLMVPHPLLQDRRFVLVPLQEISPGFLHPLLKKSVNQLLQQCNDKLDVKKI